MNAIARESDIIIGLNSSLVRIVKDLIVEYQKEVELEFKATDPNIKFEMEEQFTQKNKVYKSNIRDAVINYLNLAPHG
jgi:hypothetical protein